MRKGAADGEDFLQGVDGYATTQQRSDAFNDLGREFGQVRNGLLANALAFPPRLAQQDDMAADWFLMVSTCQDIANLLSVAWTGLSATENVPAVRDQFAQQHGLPGLAGSPDGSTDPHPVGSEVACALEPRLLDIGLCQNDPVSVYSQPVVTELTGSHAQGHGSEILDPDPGEDQEPAVANGEMTKPASLIVRPADPAITTGQRFRAVLEHQTSQVSPGNIRDEIAQMRTERTLAAQIMITGHETVPQCGPMPPGHGLKRDGCAFADVGDDRWRRICLRPPVFDGLWNDPLHVQALRWQGENIELLKPLEHPETCCPGQRALGTSPVEMFADGQGQLAAAVARQQLDSLLDGLDGFALETPPLKGGRRKGLDARVHGLLHYWSNLYRHKGRSMSSTS